MDIQILILQRRGHPQPRVLQGIEKELNLRLATLHVRRLRLSPLAEPAAIVDRLAILMQRETV
jgi:hypothetical protein